MKFRAPNARILQRYHSRQVPSRLPYEEDDDVAIAQDFAADEEETLDALAELHLELDDPDAICASENQYGLQTLVCNQKPSHEPPHVMKIYSEDGSLSDAYYWLDGNRAVWNAGWTDPADIIRG